VGGKKAAAALWDYLAISAVRAIGLRFHIWEYGFDEKNTEAVLKTGFHQRKKPLLKERYAEENQ